MKWEVGDKVIDIETRDYGMGIIKEIQEHDHWSELWIYFPKFNNRFSRASDDPFLRKWTKLDEALK